MTVCQKNESSDKQDGNVEKTVLKKLFHNLHPKHIQKGESASVDPGKQGTNTSAFLK